MEKLKRELDQLIFGSAALVGGLVAWIAPYFGAKIALFAIIIGYFLVMTASVLAREKAIPLKEEEKGNFLTLTLGAYCVVGVIVFSAAHLY